MNAWLRTSTSKRLRGLALVELIVVLLILALIAGTAITATQDMVEGTFHDTTHTTLERIDEAILGPYAPPTAHDDTLIQGFVADVGRLPLVVGTDPALALAELWTRPDDVAPFAIHQPPGDQELRIPTGWRGPYLHVGFGPTALFDGWRRPLVILEHDSTPAVAGELPGRILSRGADQDDEADDVYITIARSIASELDPAIPSRHLAPLTIRLEPTVEGGSTANVLVRVYAPVDDGVRAFDQLWFDGSSAVQTFPNEVPVGPRVVRAYDWPGSPLPGLGDREPLVPRSAPVTARLTRRGASEVVLKISPAP